MSLSLFVSFGFCPLVFFLLRCMLFISCLLLLWCCCFILYVVLLSCSSPTLTFRIFFSLISRSTSDTHNRTISVVLRSFRWWAPFIGSVYRFRLLFSFRFFSNKFISITLSRVFCLPVGVHVSLLQTTIGLTDHFYNLTTSTVIFFSTSLFPKNVAFLHFVAHIFRSAQSRVYFPVQFFVFF